MYPISKERLEWIEARIFLLGRMIQELTLRQNRYLSNPRYGQYHPAAMANMLTEQLQLNIEHRAIEEYLEEQKQAQEAREQAAALASK